ncbi:MAG: tripartite tricarboxylate transporter substrate binding protein [Hydrogenophaga sp.]|uniref:Bug family tripartite tricarboxylate transporter substrate binding protein n=1 Tax=Hydrogenophaga sp. TaxID=1904254 RepID=UPI002723579F|nr:tripartite tricarboxylate transporter substrate binding protein [Hydrogenophaga sp.]MDO9029617.1 tripartite tricarboxylate transporter substrate binding protein [Hydrogenophaga sp.]
MNRFKRKTTTLLGATLLSMLTISTGWAQDDYPSRPIRLVVPYAAGGGTDILARQLTKKVGELLGQPIIVDNKPGAGTAIGAAEVAKATPDGYTLLWGDNATFALNPHVYKKLAYDPLTSFTPVTLTVRGALVLLTADRLGVKNVNDLITLSKSQAGKLTYGTPGNGTPHHLAMEAFKLRAGNLQIQHVPYRGEAPAIQDLIGGSLDLMFAGARVAKPQTESGRAVALAVSGSKRNTAMPDVPTVSEAGLKGYVSEYWHGVVAPAKTPPAVVAKLNAAFVKAMASPELVSWINNAGSGAEWTGSTPVEMQAHMVQELKNSGELVKTIGLSLD